MKKFNSNGFGVVGVLLIVVIVGLIGGVGYFVYNSQKKTNTTLDNAAKSQGEPQKAEKKESVTPDKIDETLSWASFSPKSKIYTIKVPDGWVMLHQADECDCLLSKTLIYKKGTPAVIETTTGGRDGLSGFFISVDDKDKTNERFTSDYKKTGTIDIGSLKGTKYYYEQTTDSEGLGLPKGGKEYIYYIPKDGKYIYISYSIKPGQEDNLALVEKAVLTIK